MRHFSGSRLNHGRSFARYRTGDAYPNGGGGGMSCPPVSGVGAPVQNNCNPYGPSRSCREYYLGFDSVADVAAGTTVEITQLPQEPFVAREVIISSVISPFFVIESLTIGRTPQAVAVGAVAAEVFSSASFRAHLALDPADRGTEITFRVTNIDGNDRRFLGALLGSSQPFS